MIYKYENVTEIYGHIGYENANEFFIVEIDTENKTVLIYRKDAKGHMFSENDEIATELLKPTRVTLLIDGVVVKWG